MQLARQAAGLDVSDRIVLTLDAEGALLDAVRAHQDYIAGEALAVRVLYEELSDSEPAALDGHELRIAVRRAT